MLRSWPEVWREGQVEGQPPLARGGWDRDRPGSHQQRGVADGASGVVWELSSFACGRREGHSCGSQEMTGNDQTLSFAEAQQGRDKQ